MRQPIVVRLAEATDYPAIDRLGRLVHADHAAAHPNLFRAGATALAEDRFAHLLASPGARLLVAEGDQQVVGLVVLECREAPNYPVFEPRMVVVVEILVVEPGMQGRGVGRLLMSGAEEWARDVGAPAIELTVFEFNTNAIGFYEHLGFTTLRRAMTMPVAPAPEHGPAGDAQLRAGRCEAISGTGGEI